MGAFRSAVAVLLSGAGLLISTAVVGAAAAPDSGLGGCYRGSVLTAQRVPGTGSAGQSVRRTAELWDCSSSLLPGIGSGRFDALLPWNGGGTLTSATFTWSDGSVSTATGLPNTLWAINSGPGSGHAVQFQLDLPMNGDWYYTDNSMAVVAATFLE
ncbi:hypothetical protein OHB26_14760 [Nocardia sp. NBC_01503]|uniref:hypothetical protein n=1 Tax=Nocardia sp. NBC_01503 TaxID=2975997 RepID=UPI002E7AC4C5|nr:hypothetical protein [Nocardia sp. NBC_01503]WTL35337.1 hypothetical protein OHB26_14760 [Nocardia sp. NBC_01503]